MQIDEAVAARHEFASRAARMQRNSDVEEAALVTSRTRFSNWCASASTTLKFTVIDAELVPVPPMELQRVATNVWVAVGVQVKSKGVAESLVTTTPCFWIPRYACSCLRAPYPVASSLD